ncbi:MAG: hypothetical protein VKJ06_02050 [Vampirovibrionales bacterium]|nr:hypothetical protein [Vampirovibrionales bacterium]
MSYLLVHPILRNQTKPLFGQNISSSNSIDPLTGVKHTNFAVNPNQDHNQDKLTNFNSLDAKAILESAFNKDPKIEENRNSFIEQNSRPLRPLIVFTEE